MNDTSYYSFSTLAIRFSFYVSLAVEYVTVDIWEYGGDYRVSRSVEYRWDDAGGG